MNKCLVAIAVSFACLAFPKLGHAAPMLTLTSDEGLYLLGAVVVAVIFGVATRQFPLSVGCVGLAAVLIIVGLGSGLSNTVLPVLAILVLAYLIAVVIVAAHRQRNQMGRGTSNQIPPFPPFGRNAGGLPPSLKPEKPKARPIPPNN